LVRYILIFKTNFIPEDSGTIELGFPEEETLPKRFFGQLFYGFGKSYEYKNINFIILWNEI